MSGEGEDREGERDRDRNRETERLMSKDECFAWHVHAQLSMIGNEKDGDGMNGIDLTSSRKYEKCPQISFPVFPYVTARTTSQAKPRKQPGCVIQLWLLYARALGSDIVIGPGYYQGRSTRNASPKRIKRPQISSLMFSYATARAHLPSVTKEAARAA